MKDHHWDSFRLFRDYEHTIRAAEILERMTGCKCKIEITNKASYLLYREIGDGRWALV